MENKKAIGIMGMSYIIILLLMGYLSKGSDLITYGIAILLVVACSYLFLISKIESKGLKILAGCLVVIATIVSYLLPHSTVLLISMILGMLTYYYLHSFEFLHHQWIKIGFEILGSMTVMITHYLVIITTNNILEPLFMTAIIWILVTKLKFLAMTYHVVDPAKFRMQILLFFVGITVITDLFFLFHIENISVQNKTLDTYLYDQNLEVSTIKTKHDIQKIGQMVTTPPLEQKAFSLIPISNTLMNGMRQEANYLQQQYQKEVLQTYRTAINSTVGRQQLEQTLTTLTEHKNNTYQTILWQNILLMISMTILPIVCYFIFIRICFPKQM